MAMNQKQVQAKSILNKVMGVEDILELNINLFEGKSKIELTREYDIKKSNFISDQMSKWDKSKNAAEGEWLKLYPLGYDDWVKDYRRLTGIGQQRVIDKVNEIIRFLRNKI